MKNILLSLFLLMSQIIFAQNDFAVPYYRIEAKADSLVVPDRIYLHINLTETKSKKSTEELYSTMLNTLSALKINVKEQLSSLNFDSKHKKTLLKSQINKSERYELLLYNAPSVAQTISALKQQEIGDVSINRMEYSQKSELIKTLRIKAITKAKNDAQQVLSAVGQSVGKVLRVEEYMQESAVAYPRLAKATVYTNEISNRDDVSEFKKMNFSVQFTVHFEIK